MKFVSTQNPEIKVSLETALFTQLPEHEGLYMPEQIPQFTPEELNELQIKSLHEIAFIVLQKYIGEDIDEVSLKNIITESLTFPLPLEIVGKNNVLELFHGPTFAFKDVGARILARLIEYFVSKKRKHISVLVATSGDTGGAVASGFGGLKHIKVVILYPQGNVSNLQEEQIIRVEPNIVPIAVQGSFDLCQHMVKQAFSDPDLEKLHLTTANSINIGRLLAQIIYYVYAWAKLKNNNLRFVVPSGNMGNVTAGYMAKLMGIPIKAFLIACNSNDPVVKYFKTGKYIQQKAKRTFSNAMDIGNPSNFERILYLCNNKYSVFKKQFQAVSVTNQETVRTINEVYKNYQYLLDPHTAVAWKASTKLKNKSGENVIISTASPIKFTSEITKRTKIPLDDHEILTNLQSKPRKKFIADGEYNAVKEIMLNELS